MTSHYLYITILVGNIASPDTQKSEDSHEMLFFLFFWICSYSWMMFSSCSPQLWKLDTCTFLNERWDSLVITCVQQLVFKYSIKYCKTYDKAERAGKSGFIWKYGLLVENNIHHWLKKEVQCGMGFSLSECFLKPL